MPAWIALDHAIFSQAFNYSCKKKYLLCAFSPSIPSAQAFMRAQSSTTRRIAGELLGINDDDIVDCFVTDWMGNEWSKGAYSAFSTKSRDGDIAAFMNHLYFWSAESGSLAKLPHEVHQGSVHGAILSGERAAADIAQQLNSAA